MNKTQSQPRKFAEHRQKIGNIIFIVNSYDNPAATDTAEQLLLKALESKVTETEVFSA